MPTLRQVNVLGRPTPSAAAAASGPGRKRRRSDSDGSPRDGCADEAGGCPAGDGGANDDGNADGEGRATARQPPTLPSHAARTPSALLSRDPARLAESLGSSLADVRRARADAARGIIRDRRGTGHGSRAAEIADEVSRHCCSSATDVDCEDKEEEEGGDGGVRGIFVRPAPLLDGAVTGLDLCAKALLLNSLVRSSASASSRRGGGYETIDCIRTGSEAVDELLAPCEEYASFDGGWSMPRPFNIPNFSAGPEGHDGPRASRGVPFGMVTEFAGPPSSGKTQLALGVAARAALECGMRVEYVTSSGGGSGGRRALSRRLFALFLEIARGIVLDGRERRGSIGDAAHRSVEEEAGTLAMRALERVHVSSVPDAHSLLAALARIDHEESLRGSREVDDGDDDAGGSGTLLVVDSASGCIGHHLSSDAGPALASQVALTLRRMARAHDGRLVDVNRNDGGGASDEPGGTTTTATVRARRFAVVVTNGSVAKRANGDNDDPTPGRHKPAMGRYWHASDVGIWLEEEEDRSRHPTNFYDGTPVVGLFLAEKKVVRATLRSHYGRPCGRGRGGAVAGGVRGGGDCEPFAKFRIRSGGVADL